MGPLTALVLDELMLDVVFLGVDGLDAQFGASCHNEGEASTNSTMARRSRRVVAVADSSKFAKQAFARICHARELDTVITDSDAPDAYLAPFEEQGVKVVRA